MPKQSNNTFETWFETATGNKPYPFQVRFAEESEFPELVDIPTGMGKTAMAVLGWMWRRRFANETIQKATPRRLVYCLPMRVLVEQTKSETAKWITQQRNHYPNEMADPLNVHVLMGGEDEEDWDMYPERDQILIGTQDMLLSRALNRGYAATRSRWPMKFGLLNMDCLWVFDEIQLMGSGLSTTTQLEAFRRLLPHKDADEAKSAHGCRSVWMSATLHSDWLKTVDLKDHVDGFTTLELDQADHENVVVKKRWTAKKPLGQAGVAMGNLEELAKKVLEAHKPGTRTLVIVNTVKRASDLWRALTKPNFKPKIVLLHSRFRPEDRQNQLKAALAEIQPEDVGTIVVSTQVVEAGVDVSATTLFTELAPWTSLVQRFGRCNRRGEVNESSTVLWIALPNEETFKRCHPDKVKDKDGKPKSPKQIKEALKLYHRDLAQPYELNDLEAARNHLAELTDVGLKSLPDIPLHFEHTHVARQKDLIDLFDTTPDLAGYDIDIDRFIRDVEDSDVRVFWRDFDKTPNETSEHGAEPAPRREELCPAPIGEFKKFATGLKNKGRVWRWNFLEKNWERVDEGKVVPGQVYLVNTQGGGYSPELGWNPEQKDPVDPIDSLQASSCETCDATDADPLSQIHVWQTIAEHTEDLCRAVDQIILDLSLTQDEKLAVRHAARWHDRGKAHEIFRGALPDGSPDPAKIWAKAAGKWKRYTRRHFRHELASALSVLDPRNKAISNEIRDLVAYLVAAHHGKVRLSIRSLPNETRPDGNRRVARGIWDNDEFPETDLGGGVTAPAITLSLEPMELGLCEEPPFTGLPSWAERMIRLRETLGPFRLAYLESILRAADMRASRDAAQNTTEEQPSQGSPAGEGRTS